MSTIPASSLSLFIEQVKPEKYSEIEQIANDWERIARDKKKGVKESEEPAARARLGACANIAGGVEYTCSQLRKGLWQEREVYACKDQTGQVHGLAVIMRKAPWVYVNDLVTHPRNIRCKANQNEHFVEGVGRTFCQFLETQAPNYGIQSVYLEALGSSVEFYRKNGFEMLPNGEMVKILPTSSPVSRL